jgi:hypothetical protein
MTGGKAKKSKNRVADGIFVKEACIAGHKAEDKTELSGSNSVNICGFFYHQFFHYVIMLQFGGGFPAQIWGTIH